MGVCVNPSEFCSLDFLYVLQLSVPTPKEFPLALSILHLSLADVQGFHCGGALFLNTLVSSEC